MRLLINDADPTEVQSALTHVDAPGASVLMNPQWLTPYPSEKLWIACGKPALQMVQAAGWIPKKGGVNSLHGKLFKNVQPDGWGSPISLGVSFAPQIMHIDYSDFVQFQCDLAIYRRFETTGNMEPQLGNYTYAPDLSGVVRYCKARHAETGAPVEVALDLETEGLDPFNPDKDIVSISASAKEGISDVVYTLGMPQATLDILISQLAWLVTCPWIKVVGANFKYDMLWMRVKWAIIVTNFAFDTCNGGSLVEENRPNTLNLHTKIYSPELGGYDDHFNATQDKSNMGAVPKETLLPYAGGDTDACLRNYKKIRAQLLADNPAPSGKPAKNSLTGMYMNVAHPAISALHKMEYTGACVDVEKFHEFGADLENRMYESMAHAASVLPKSLIDKYGGLTETGGAPLSKPNMIAEFLFSPTGLNLKPKQTTPTGKPSTAQHHLEQFKDHPEAAAVIERYIDFKTVSKMHGTYYKGFLKHLRSDNRWHSSYIIHKQGDGKNNEQSAAGTVTGRGSATNPAFQCVTFDTEIFTRNGIELAGPLIDKWIPDFQRNPHTKHHMDIWGTGGFNTTSRVFRSWRYDILKVTLANGNELKCTPEHPFKTTGHGWVKAKSLTGEHQLVVPARHDRVTCSEQGLTPKLAEALGLITGSGTITLKHSIFMIEVPRVYGAWLAGAITKELNTVCKAEFLGDTMILSFKIDPQHTSDTMLLFCLALPDSDCAPIWQELRGTTLMYPFLRGFLRAAGSFRYDSRGYAQIVAKVSRKALALALLRETALEGLVPPMIRPMQDGYRITWHGKTAEQVALRAGYNPEAWVATPTPSGPDYQKKPSLVISKVEAAEAAWVYDFTVPTTNDFMANGMLVHNTVPKHSYWGKRLRSCIIAPPGYVIIARDYSQGELKVTACWAGETQMIKAYQNDIDLHTLTAATVNAMSYEEALYLKKHDYPKYEVLRQSGKAGNFGLIYGMGAYGFMMYADQAFGVKLTIEEAEDMRNAFFALYPGLVDWHQKQIMEAVQTGYVRSPLGRTRHLPNITSPIKKIREGAQRQAINSPIQGTLVDMMWMSMGIIERDKPKLLLPFAQIHDQGIWYTPEARVDEALQYTGEIMEDLPFEKTFGWKPELVFNTDAEVGLNLAGLEKVA